MKKPTKCHFDPGAPMVESLSACLNKARENGKQNVLTAAEMASDALMIAAMNYYCAIGSVLKAPEDNWRVASSELHMAAIVFGEIVNHQ